MGRRTWLTDPGSCHIEMRKGIKFCESPIEEIECDLEQLTHLPLHFPNERLFLQAGDAFCLDYDKLMQIAELALRYPPAIKSIGAYARVDDISGKTAGQLKSLRDALQCNSSNVADSTVRTSAH